MCLKTACSWVQFQVLSVWVSAVRAATGSRLSSGKNRFYKTLKYPTCNVLKTLIFQMIQRPDGKEASQHEKVTCLNNIWSLPLKVKERTGAAVVSRSLSSTFWCLSTKTQGRHLYCPSRGLLQLHGALIDPEYWSKPVRDFKIQQALLGISEEMRTIVRTLIYQQQETS